jgi:hypothetical protein
MAREPINLAIISLGTSSKQDTARLQPLLRQSPATQVFRLAPAQQGSGLTTLLMAESLETRHLLAKPIQPNQLRTLVHFAFPQPVQQD